jgi:hypothetical protein
MGLFEGERRENCSGMGPVLFCPDCGSKKPANSPARDCPHCLLRLGLVAGLSIGPVEEIDDGGAPERNGALRRADHHAVAARVENLEGSVLKDLDQSIGPVNRVMLREWPTGAPLVGAHSSEMRGPSGCDGRYRLEGELARGGMGAVLKGRDVNLGRDLAIKVILEEHRDLPRMVRRFVEEAQIGGQLQRPGIVPVYELGRFPDGRLYIAMKLIRGRTLAALLVDRQGLLDDKPRFLSIFEQVCQTMAYAHSRGVVHRDLKHLKPDTWRARELIATAWSDWGDWNAAIEEHSEAVRKMIALEARLPALLSGNDRPADATELAEFAQLCSYKKLYVTSARLWSDAFAARPALVVDAGEENRYQAARAAAQAGCGLGEDDPSPDQMTRQRFRFQALDWLNAEVADVGRLLEEGTPLEFVDVPKRLGRWQIDPGWEELRGDAANDGSPLAERRAFRELWSKVEGLRLKAGGRPRCKISRIM